MNSNIKTASRAPLAVSLAVMIACVFGASSAFADNPLRVETVNFRDLNVATPAGVEALYRRIQAAADRVCRERDRMEQQRAIACAKKAEAQAVEDLSLPLLTAYHRAKTGRSTQPLSASR